MTINDLLIDIKMKIQSDLSEEELEKYTFLGRCLVELQAYQNMYQDDLVRVNKYYEEYEKEFENTVRFLGGE